MDMQKIEMLFQKAKETKDPKQYLEYCREMKKEIFKEEKENG